MYLGLFDYEAKRYFMKSESYFSVPLPPYFDFTKILADTERAMGGRGLDELRTDVDIREAGGVNYSLPMNKDGGQAWRDFQLIHPAVYVAMVNLIVRSWDYIDERMRLFASQDSVKAVGVAPGMRSEKSPTAASILKWWHGMEQTSLKMSLYYNYMVVTDVMECYSSISVDLVARAIGGALGRKVAKLISDSREGRNMGIPQGSLLLDFVAEIVLGYVDVVFHNTLRCRRKELKWPKGAYTVVRYRDDYRIFARDEVVAREVLRVLSDALARFGLKLNATKTRVVDDVVLGARKEDKRYWEARQSMVMFGDEGEVKDATIQKSLLVVYELALKYPNSGSIARGLYELYRNRIVKLEHRPGDAYPLLGIIANIMAKNSRASAIGVACLSRILSFNPGISRNTMADVVLDKARMMPGREYLEVCLQRLTIKNKPSKNYGNKLCRLVYDQSAKIWNSKWISIKVRDSEAVNHKVVKEMKFVVPVEEVDVFDDYNVEMEVCDEGEDDEG